MAPSGSLSRPFKIVLLLCFTSARWWWIPSVYCYQPNCIDVPSDSQYIGFDMDLDLIPRSDFPDACEDAGENPRGKYNAKLAPCVVQFHQVPIEQIEQENDSLSPFRLSTACSQDNLVGGKEGSHRNTVKEYVKKWPDDCVGDFQRCYSVFRDEEIFLTFVCSKGLTFPKGTTHISVDCKADKARKLGALEDKVFRNKDPDEDPYFQANEKRIQDIKMAVLVLFVACLTAVTVFFCVSYRLIVVPYFCLLQKQKDADKAD